MRKRNYAGLITFIIFLLVVAGTGVAVVYFGTKTGMEIGGDAVVTGNADVAKQPFYAQTGFIRNNSPWPVTITDLTVDSTGTTAAPEVYLVDKAPDAPGAGKKPDWATTPLKLPLTLKGGQLFFLGFGVTAKDGEVATFDTVSLKFKGPLPIGFSSSLSGVTVATQALDLPPGLTAVDPKLGPDSLDGYIQAVRAALVSHKTVTVQKTMGPATTKEQATAFFASQKGYKPAFNVLGTPLNDDPTTQKLQFYQRTPEHGLPTFTAHWSNYRWTITLDPK